jgi:DNA helicase II / ATP-dependent DNA helicase PcrA
MSIILDGLNESQREAVTAPDRYLLVVAGPGTGKTLTIVRRIAYLLEQGASPDEIIAVTFTNRAAREMRERIEALLRTQASGMFIGTFHLLGLKIIRDSLQAHPMIIGRDEQIDLLKPIAGNSSRAARQAAEKISRIKNLIGSGVQGLGSRAQADEPHGETRQIYQAYQAALKEKGACDFDDLILIPIDLLRAGNVAGRFAGTSNHIIVDEYQDISPAQYVLLKCLAHDQSTLCAVGDSDQAIYSFRGADVQNFIDFQKEFADAAVVVLRENYRSTKVVVGAAQGLIKNNLRRIEKELRAGREQGASVRVLSVADEKAEADAIVLEIEARMGGTSHYRLSSGNAPRDFSETTYAFSDFAVLFRTNAQAKALREALEEWGIPCQALSEVRPLDRRALTQYLRSVVDTLPEQLDLRDLLKHAGEEAGLRDQESGLLENLAAAYQHLPPRDAITEIINELSLLTTADAFDPRADAVALMTLHMAKGLEFKVVFVVGCEEGLLPFTLAKDDADIQDIEEERRLFYVGMTRAKDELFLLHTRNRFLYGQKLSGVPSVFLAEIPQTLVRSDSVPDKPRKQKQGTQPTMF